MKAILAIIATIAAIAAAVFLGALWLGDRKLDRRVDVRVVPVAYAQPTPDVLKLGKYLYETRGCGECHGMDGAGRVITDGKAGGPYVRTPDITTSKVSMVAAYSEADWVRAIRHGIDPAGRALLVMPSIDYNRMTDADFSALVAYVRTLPPGKGEIGEVRFPLLLQALYGVGVVKDSAETIDHKLPPATPVPVAETREHGGYVANMCIGCHGPALSGGKIPGAPPDWPPASNLTPGEGTVMARYEAPEAFAAMLRTGKRPDGTEVNKAMPFESLKNLNELDIRAMHAFLRTLPPRKAGDK